MPEHDVFILTACKSEAILWTAPSSGRLSCSSDLNQVGLQIQSEVAMIIVKFTMWIIRRLELLSEYYLRMASTVDDRRSKWFKAAGGLEI